MLKNFGDEGITAREARSLLGAIAALAAMDGTQDQMNAYFLLVMGLVQMGHSEMRRVVEVLIDDASNWNFSKKYTDLARDVLDGLVSENELVTRMNSLFHS